MSWSPTFINALYDQSKQFDFHLRFLDLNNDVGSAFSVFSFGNAPLKIGSSGVSVQGVSIVPSRWSVSFGGFTVEVVGDPTELFLLTARGSFAEILCRINGSSWSRIAIGQLHKISKRGIAPSYKLIFTDIISALQNRTDSNVGATPTPSSSNPPRQDLFFETGITIQLSQSWTVGDSWIYLNDVSKFRRETGQNGIIKVQSSSSATPFYLEFDSVDVANNRLSTTPNSGQEAFPSTTAAYNLPIFPFASFATVCVQIDDKPFSIFGKLITSTGAGTNGSLDTLPVEWSVGGQFDAAIFDHTDAQNFFNSTVRGRTSSNYAWRFITDSPYGSGLRDFVSLAAVLGQFPVMRHGQLTWRACADPEGSGMSYTPPIAGYISDRDIITVQSHELFDPSQQSIKVISTLDYTTQTAPITTILQKKSVGTRSSSGKLSSFPAEREIVRSSTFLFSPDQNQSDMANGDLDRYANWDHYTWEKISLSCNLGTAQFVAGEIVEVTSNFLAGLKEVGGSTFNRKKCMVLSSSFDFRSNSSVIVLGCISGNN